MKLGIARKTLEVIEDNHVRLAHLRIEITQQRHHTGAAHEITATAYIIGKHGFDVITLLISIGAAALFLAFKATAFQALLGRRDAAVDQRVPGLV